MGQSQKPPSMLKKIKLLTYVSLVFAVLSLVLLLWAYRLDRDFQFWRRYYGAAPHFPQKCIPGRTVLQEEHASVVAVNGTKTLLVSAYLEHRAQEKEVRVIAMVLRRETVAYRCFLCCQKKLHISKGVCDVYANHFYFDYGTADIMCPVPSGCGTPSHITVTSAEDVSEVTLQAAVEECADKPDQRFVEVKNQKMKNDSFPYNFTVCLSTMFEFTNVLQLVQGLEMMRLLGVNRVVVYKTNCSSETQCVLDYYTHKGLVEVIPWSLSRFMTVSHGWLPSHGPGDLHYFGQIPALNDCLYRYMYQSRYLALHDADELILPQSVNSWLELMPLLEKKYGADQCYKFENFVFPNTVRRPPPSPETLPRWQNVSGVNILDHLYHEPTSPERYSNFKVIVNPRPVLSVTVHGVLWSQKGCSRVDGSVARMYHTRAPKQPQLTPEQLIYDDRLLSYSAHLVPAVDAVLRESGLLPEDSVH